MFGVEGHRDIFGTPDFDSKPNRDSAFGREATAQLSLSCLSGQTAEPQTDV